MLELSRRRVSIFFLVVREEQNTFGLKYFLLAGASKKELPVVIGSLSLLARSRIEVAHFRDFVCE